MICLILFSFTSCIDEKNPSSKTISLKDGEIKIALIDTGVDTNVVTSDDITQGYNYILNSADTTDTIGHGTSVAGILLGSEVTDNQPLIDDISVVPLVVQAEIDGEIVTANQEILAKSIYDAIDIYACDVINMSLGIEQHSNELEDAVKYAYDKGSVIVSSVGNSGILFPDALYYPAAFDEVIGVGSVNLNNEVSSFSQINETVTLMGYGEGYYIALPDGAKTLAHGTSFAVPFVTSAAASNLKNNPDLSPEEILEILIETATDIEDDGYDIKSGYGICTQPVE